MPAQDGQVVREMMPVSTESGSKIAHGSLLLKETREHVQADRRREQPGSISQLSGRSLCGHVRQNHRRHTAGLRGGGLLAAAMGHEFDGPWMLGRMDAAHRNAGGASMRRGS